MPSQPGGGVPGGTVPAEIRRPGSKLAGRVGHPSWKTRRCAWQDHRDATDPPHPRPRRRRRAVA
jgi:hypothetical protein